MATFLPQIKTSGLMRLAHHVVSHCFSNETQRDMKAFLQQGDVVAVLGMMAQGHSLTPAQSRHFLEQVLEKPKLLEEALRKKLPIPDKTLVDYLFHNYSSFKSFVGHYLFSPQNHQYCQTPLLKELYEQKLQDNLFKKQLFAAWQGIIKDLAHGNIQFDDHIKRRGLLYDSPKRYFERRVQDPILDLSQYILAPASREEYVQCLSWLNKIPDYRFKSIDSKRKAGRSYRKEQESYHGPALANRLSYNLSFESSKASSIEDKKTAIEALILPGVGQTLLQDIKQTYEALLKDASLMNMKDQFELENIYKNQLPHLLHSYRLSSHGVAEQSSEAVLCDNLAQILQIFNQKVEHVNEEKMRMLQVTGAYIKTLKNTI